MIGLCRLYSEIVHYLVHTILSIILFYLLPFSCPCHLFAYLRFCSVRFGSFDRICLKNFQIYGDNRILSDVELEVFEIALNSR